MAGRARLSSARRAAIDGVRRRAEYIYRKICHFRADFLCNCRRAARWDSTPYLLWFRLRRLGDRRALPPAVTEAVRQGTFCNFEANSIAQRKSQGGRDG